VNSPTPCRTCGAPILFIETPRGKLIPVDAERFAVVPGPTAKGKFVTSGGRVISASIVDPRVEPGALVGYRAHFATCPGAAAWRNPSKAP